VPRSLRTIAGCEALACPSKDRADGDQHAGPSLDTADAQKLVHGFFALDKDTKQKLRVSLHSPDQLESTHRHLRTHGKLGKAGLVAWTHRPLGLITPTKRS
jgi:hypothetical protein